MHKLLLATILAPLIASYLLPEANADTNLFPQGNMEETTEVEGMALPKGWEKPPTNIALEPDQTHFVDGESSLRLTLNEGGQGWVRTQIIQVQPGHTYEITCSMRLASPGPLPFCGVRIYDSAAGWSPASGYLLESQQDREWFQKKARFTASPEAKWIYIGFLTKGVQGASVNLDALTIEPIE
jgi:hypothetical protein